jgi:hypothetical protein
MAASEVKTSLAAQLVLLRSAVRYFGPTTNTEKFEFTTVGK